MTTTRVLAWVCILFVLFAAAIPAAAGPPAILADAGPLVGAPSGSVRLRAADRVPSPDSHTGIAHPARAPPLA